mmetsp:Transcript_120155/g.340085  ORF Transcript_120155/g.340085 Transcript_120155/m.340085 type:complete len:272 (-) Transcript_120155:1039-1854(-)
MTPRLLRAPSKRQSRLSRQSILLLAQSSRKMRKLVGAQPVAQELPVAQPLHLARCCTHREAPVGHAPQRVGRRRRCHRSGHRTAPWRLRPAAFASGAGAADSGAGRQAAAPPPATCPERLLLPHEAFWSRARWSASNAWHSPGGSKRGSWPAPRSPLASSRQGRRCYATPPLPLCGHVPCVTLASSPPPEPRGGLEVPLTFRIAAAVGAIPPRRVPSGFSPTLSTSVPRTPAPVGGGSPQAPWIASWRRHLSGWPAHLFWTSTSQSACPSA